MPIDISLLETCLQDVYSGRKDLRDESARDFNYISNRFRSEGLTFLTTVLPCLGKAVISGLETGHFLLPAGFRKLSGSSLPAFMRGLMKSIFHSDGRLRDDADAYSVGEIMQVSMLFYKFETPYKESLNQAVIDEFISVEGELAKLTLPQSGIALEIAIRARSLVHRLLNGVDLKDINPQHGPGAVATGERGNAKYIFKRKYQRLHETYPYYEYFSPSLGKISFESGWYKRLRPEINPVAKVVLVPKDSRGPRLISMEPLEIQWIQQGLMKRLVSHIESHPLTKGRVNFENQGINGQLALESSISRKFATLDLKSASDRVSIDLVKYLFPKELHEPLMCTRSVATKLPNGELLPLRKFAPMGSALCFPVLAVCVWSILNATVSVLYPGDPDFPDPADSVYVYGDDALVPTFVTESCFRALTAFGLKPNVDKSFYRGFFRESCGVDAFKGVITTPLRLRRTSSDADKRDPKLYKHLLALSESFFNKGFWRTCRHLRGLLQDRFGALHWTTLDSDGLRSPEYSVCLDRNRSSHKTRWNARLQRQEFRVKQVNPVYSKQEIAWHGRLLRGVVNPTGVWSDPHRVAVRRACTFKHVWSGLY